MPKERRKDKVRFGMSMPCVVSTNTKTSEEGTTFDISKGGMCIFSERCLETGQDIELQCKTIWDKPKIGTVKWCRKIKHNLYRIGISFS